MEKKEYLWFINQRIFDYEKVTGIYGRIKIIF